MMMARGQAGDPGGQSEKRNTAENRKKKKSREKQRGSKDKARKKLNQKYWVGQKIRIVFSIK